MREKPLSVRITASAADGERANRAQCITWFAESKSILRAQQNFLHGCERKAPVGEAIGCWFNQWKRGKAQIACTITDARRRY
jgi:hypothetical protein